MAEKVSHKCVLCNSVFGSKEDLQLHFRKHANGESGSRRYDKGIRIACDVCGEEFANKTVAIKHKFKKHPGAAVNYICPYCGMQFPLKPFLDNHLGTHGSDTREKSSLRCDECGAEFYFQKAKDYHMRSTHVRVKTLIQPVPTPPPSKKIKVNNANEVQSVYYCHICGSEYIIKFNLQKHLEKNHTEEERSNVPADLIRCTTCDALFYNQKAYETHNTYHNPDDLYVASEEQRLQTVTRVDQDFDIRRVLPAASKYIPRLGRKPGRKKKKLKSKTTVQEGEEDDEEELSPPSSPESSDSDSEKSKEAKDDVESLPLDNVKDKFKKTDSKKRLKKVKTVSSKVPKVKKSVT